MLGKREQECVPTGIPKAQAPYRPGGGTFPSHRSVSRPAPSDPSGPRMRARAGALQALPEGKISRVFGGWGVATGSLEESFFLMLLFTVKHILDL